LRDDTGAWFMRCEKDQQVALYHAGNKKLDTTSTGIDVTGTVTADGLTVANTGNITLDSGTGETHSITLSHKGSYAEVNAIELAQGSTTYGNNQIKFLNMNSTGSVVETMRIAGGGDISFYNAAGSAAKFFWDASAESLGIGTSSPNEPLDIESATNATTGTVAITRDFNGTTTTNRGALVLWGKDYDNWYSNGEVGPMLLFGAAEDDRSANSGDLRAGIGVKYNGNLTFHASSSSVSNGSSERMRIDSSGKVGIGTSSPQTTIDLNGAQLMRANAGNIGLGTYTVGSGMTAQSGGELEFMHMWSGTMHTNDTIVFRYNAISWKSWWFEMTAASTGGYGHTYTGGYYNNSGGVDSLETIDTDMWSTAVSYSGQNIIVTVTLNRTWIHPLIKIKFGCGGGEGFPQLSRCSLVVNT